MAEPKRVCVTGIGAVSPYGRDAASFWRGLTSGTSAVAAISSFDATSLPCTIAGEVRDYAPREDMDPEAVQAMSRRSLFAADAAIQALIESEIPVTAESVTSIGVAIGSELPEGAETTAADVARTISAGATVSQFSNGAPSGLMAIGEAAEWIRREDCAVAIAGGADTPISAKWIEHYHRAGMLTHNNVDPQRAIKPYDRARDGFALAEGAAMAVLEDEDLAIRRGATILAYLDGYGSTFNRSPVAHPAPNSIDLARAMQTALMKWDVTLQGEIDVIFGTAGGGAIDVIEGQAINRVWGPNKDRIWVTAIRAALGHTLGASSAFSLLAAIYCLQSGLIPPTLNLTEQDPECGELEIVTGDVRRLHGTKAIVNGSGIGHNASIIVSRP